jgi:hypothetical protein
VPVFSTGASRTFIEVFAKQDFGIAHESEIYKLIIYGKRSDIRQTQNLNLYPFF